MFIRSCWLIVLFRSHIRPDLLSSSIIVEKEMMKSPTIVVGCLFLLSVLSAFTPHILHLCCSVHTHFKLFCCLNGMNVTLCNFLKTTLSDINIATPAFYWFVFAQCIFFCPFIFTLTILLYLRFSFLYTAYTWVMFFNPLFPSLLIDIVRPLTFNIIMDILDLNLFFISLVYFFWFPLDHLNIFRIPFWFIFIVFEYLFV